MIAPHPHERPLRAALALTSLLFWLGLALLLWTIWDRSGLSQSSALSLGDIALLTGTAAIVTYLGMMLRHIGRAAWLLGYAVETGPEQYPDLHTRVRACAKRLGVAEPLSFLFGSPRDVLSYSLRYRGRDYLALNGELIGALTDHQGSIDFFIGYELACLQEVDRHFRWLILPGRVLPLLGPAYERAKIYTRDRYGIAACRMRGDAALALAPLISGSRRWKSVNIAQYSEQSLRGDLGFTFFELVSSEPYLARRVAHLRGVATGEGAHMRRHPLAWIGAAFVPGLAPWNRGALVRTMFALLWPAVIGITLWHGYLQLADAGWIEPVESRFENKPAPLPKTAPPPIPLAPAATETQADLYARLDMDLRRLGEVALNRYRKLGGIPCEVGNIAALDLHYRAARYAYSCDGPTVYTVVEPGEFESGRPAFLRTYNWKESKFTNALPPIIAVPLPPIAPVDAGENGENRKPAGP